MLVTAFAIGTCLINIIEKLVYFNLCNDGDECSSLPFSPFTRTLWYYFYVDIA